MLTSWLLFVASGAGIVVAGTALSRYGNRIAELTGLGRAWVGMVLMAAATSLPEAITSVSAGFMGAPELAAGDLFGASMANMFTFGLIDLLHRQKRIWQQAAFEHVLTASLAVILTAVAAFMVLFRRELEFAGTGIGSMLLFLMYVLGMRVIFRQEDVNRRRRDGVRMAERGKNVDAETAHHNPRKPVLRASLGFGLATIALIIAAPFLAVSAQYIADAVGISSTFIGTSLVAIVTTLPELVTSFAAVRLGAFDLAVGNLFGSNAFNMAIFVFVDLAYRQGAILDVISTAHAGTALWAILMMNIGLMGIIYRVERRYLFIEPDSAVMIAGYFVGLWLLFG